MNILCIKFNLLFIEKNVDNVESDITIAAIVAVI